MNIVVLRNTPFDKTAGISRIRNAYDDKKYNLTFITRKRHNLDKNDPKVNFRQLDDCSVFELNIKEVENSKINKVTNLYAYINLSKKVIKKLINKNKVDLIYAFDLDSGIVANYFYKKYKIDYIYHVADFYVDSRYVPTTFLKKLVKNEEFRIINDAKRTVICTEDRREQIEGSSPKDLRVIENIPTIEEKYSNQRYEYKIGDKLIISYIGVLSNRRFIKELIELVSQNLNYELIIGGRGELSSYVMEKSKEFSNIQFLGEVNYSETFRYYLKANLMVAIYDPSVRNHKYAAPNKIFESLATGTPIIVANNTGQDYWIDKLNIGYRIDYEIDSFKQCLNYISQHKDELLEKHYSAANLYEQYNWGIIKQKYLDLIDD